MLRNTFPNLSNDYSDVLPVRDEFFRTISLQIFSHRRSETTLWPERGRVVPRGKFRGALFARNGVRDEIESGRTLRTIYGTIANSDKDISAEAA